MANRLFPEAIQGTPNFSATIGAANTHLQQGVTEFLYRGVLGAISAINVIGTAAEQPSRILGGYDPDFFNRFYIYPNPLRVLNPVVGFPNSYALWNAQNGSDEIFARTVVNNVPGLTNTAIVGTIFAPFEEKRFSVTIGATAPYQTNESYVFDFITAPNNTFVFQADRTNLLSDRPLIPLTETLVYNTQIMTSHNGTEQRISFRDAPRVSYSLSYLLRDDVAARRKKADLLERLNQEFLFPRWHEGVVVTQQVATSGVNIFGDFSLSDIDEDQFVIIYNTLESQYHTAGISNKTNTQITLDTGMPFTLPRGSVVYPLDFGYHRDGAAIGRYPVNASEYRLTFWRGRVEKLGGFGATITYHNGLPVLEQVPLNDELLEESADQMIEIIDYDNAWDQFTRKPVASLGGARKFWIESPQERQYWKKFLDSIGGRREPFYLCSNRIDLFLAEVPIPASFSIVIINDKATTGYDWITDYQQSLAHQTLKLTTSAGVFYKTVTSISLTETGNVRLNFAEPLPGTAFTVSLVQFMEKVRLDSDTVVLRHYYTHSELDLSVRTVNE